MSCVNVVGFWKTSMKNPGLGPLALGGIKTMLLRYYWSSVVLYRKGYLYYQYNVFLVPKVTTGYFFFVKRWKIMIKMRVVKDIFETHKQPYFFPVRFEMASFVLMICDFVSRSYQPWTVIFHEIIYLVHLFTMNCYFDYVLYYFRYPSLHNYDNQSVWTFWISL